jgi:hypothetical protein
MRTNVKFCFAIDLSRPARQVTNTRNNDGKNNGHRICLIYETTNVFATSDSNRILLEFDFRHPKSKEFEWTGGQPGFKTACTKQNRRVISAKHAD